MLDSNLMSENDYNELLFNYEENDTFKKLCDEMMKNPRTQTIPKQVTAMTVNIAAQAFSTLLTEDEYDKVAINIATQFNDISSIPDRDTKVTVLSQKTQDVAGEYNVNMPESVADATADALVSQFQDREQINSKDVHSFLEQYKDFNFGGE
jgi:flagellar motor switch protein FliM